MLAETEPLAVWDVREASWPPGPLRRARTAWLAEHGLPDLYRIEFRVADGTPSARLFRHHRNAEGRRHWNDAHIPGLHDHTRCGPAVEEPRDVLLSELPPRDLLYL